jgi:preprotein translocase subunit SecE
MEAASSGVGTKLEPRRLVGISYVVFALIGALFLHQVIARLLGALRVSDPALFGIQGFTVSSLIGVLLAAGVALYCFFNQRIYAGSLNVATELKRVTWPSVAEIRVSTIAVIIASLIAALILFFFDLISSMVMTEWVPGLLDWLARL